MVFLFALSSPPPGVVAVLKQQQPMILVQTLLLGSRCSRADLICKLLVLSVLTCVSPPEGPTQVLISVWANSESRPEKLNVLFQKAARQNNNPQMPGVRLESRHKIDHLRPDRKNGEILCEIRTFRRTCVCKEYSGKFRKPHTCPGQDTCSENIWEDPKFSSQGDP